MNHNILTEKYRSGENKWPRHDTVIYCAPRLSLNLFPPSPPYQAPGEPPAPSHTWAHSVQWTPTAAWATDWPDRDLSVPKISHSCLYFQSLQVSHVRLFTTPRTAARQAALSITNSQSLLRLNVYWVGDAIQPSHPPLSRSCPTFNLSQHQGLFKWFIFIFLFKLVFL